MFFFPGQVVGTQCENMTRVTCDVWTGVGPGGRQGWGRAGRRRVEGAGQHGQCHSTQGRAGQAGQGQQQEQCWCCFRPHHSPCGWCPPHPLLGCCFSPSFSGKVLLSTLPQLALLPCWKLPFYFFPSLFGVGVSLASVLSFRLFAHFIFMFVAFFFVTFLFFCSVFSFIFPLFHFYFLLFSFCFHFHFQFHFLFIFSVHIFIIIIFCFFSFVISLVLLKEKGGGSTRDAQPETSPSPTSPSPFLVDLARYFLFRSLRDFFHRSGELAPW